MGRRTDGKTNADTKHRPQIGADFRRLKTTDKKQNGKKTRRKADRKIGRQNNTKEHRTIIFLSAYLSVYFLSVSPSLCVFEPL